MTDADFASLGEPHRARPEGYRLTHPGNDSGPALTGVDIPSTTGRTSLGRSDGGVAWSTPEFATLWQTSGTQPTPARPEPARPESLTAAPDSVPIRHDSGGYSLESHADVDPSRSAPDSPRTDPTAAPTGAESPFPASSGLPQRAEGAARRINIDEEVARIAAEATRQINAEAALRANAEAAQRANAEAAQRTNAETAQRANAEAAQRANAEAAQRTNAEATPRANADAAQRTNTGAAQWPNTETAQRANTGATQWANTETAQRTNTGAAQWANTETAQRTNSGATQWANAETAQRANTEAAQWGNAETAQRADAEAAQRANAEAVQRANIEAAQRVIADSGKRTGANAGQHPDIELSRLANTGATQRITSEPTPYGTAEGTQRPVADAVPRVNAVNAEAAQRITAENARVNSVRHTGTTRHINAQPDRQGEADAQHTEEFAAHRLGGGAAHRSNSVLGSRANTDTASGRRANRHSQPLDDTPASVDVHLVMHLLLASHNLESVAKKAESGAIDLDEFVRAAYRTRTAAVDLVAAWFGGATQMREFAEALLAATESA
ncbi:hypothetical protein GZH49_19820 [Nocardia terpenica]|uniref:hypothetical protein n=1 Tax=Nocardia terpenica TaxID=455432 RepID=UPI002FE138AC